VIECPVCHVSNDDQARFCLECGQRFSPPTSARPSGQGSQPSPTQGFPNKPANNPYMDNNSASGRNPQDENPPKRPKLHSPMLQGDDMDDDYPTSVYAEIPDRGAKPLGKGKPGGLRSPLLGGGDDDDFDEAPRSPAKPLKGAPPKGKGGLRSPLLGGADDEDDYEEDFPLRDKKSASANTTSHFPHRNRTPIADPENLPAPGQATGGRPHLRSPLLEGDDDFEEPRTKQRPEPMRGQKSPGGGRFGAPPAPSGRPGKLHSPLFDSADSNDDYYEEENEYVEIDDPNVLRSPLLAARSKVPIAPHEDPPQQRVQHVPPAQMRPPMPQTQGPGAAPPMPYQGQGAPPPMPYQAQAPGQMPPMPQAQGPGQMPQMPQQGMPGPLPQMPQQGMPGQLPQMPQQGMSGQLPQMPQQGMPGQLPPMPQPGMPGQLPPMPQPSAPGQTPQYNPNSAQGNPYGANAPDTGYGAQPKSPGTGYGAPTLSMESPVGMQQLGQLPGMNLGATPSAPLPALPPLPTLPEAPKDDDKGWQPLSAKSSAKKPSLEEQFPEEPKPRSTGRSKALSAFDDDDILPSRRKSAPESQPQTEVSRGLGRSGPIMILFIPAFCGVMAQCYVIFVSAQQLLKYNVLLVDHLSTLVVMIGITIFAATGVKK
jgi:hypothetical protein